MIDALQAATNGLINRFPLGVATMGLIRKPGGGGGSRRFRTAAKIAHELRQPGRPLDVSELQRLIDAHKREGKAITDAIFAELEIREIEEELAALLAVIHADPV